MLTALPSTLQAPRPKKKKRNGQHSVTTVSPYGKELRKLALLKSVKRGRKTRMVLRSVTGHQIANHGIATLGVNRENRRTMRGLEVS